MEPGANLGWVCSAARRAMCRRLSFKARHPTSRRLHYSLARARQPRSRLAPAHKRGQWGRRGATFSAGRTIWVVARPNPSADDARNHHPRVDAHRHVAEGLGNPPRPRGRDAGWRRSPGPRRRRIRPVTDQITSRRPRQSPWLTSRSEDQVGGFGGAAPVCRRGRDAGGVSSRD
jgi:hypothetical protein